MTFVPNSVAKSEILKMLERVQKARATSVLNYLTSPRGFADVPKALTFAADFTVQQDDTLLFFLVLDAYKRRPSYDAARWIYSHFIRPPGSRSYTKGGHGVVAPARGPLVSEDTTVPRELNITPQAREAAFEKVTGARTFAGKGADPANVFFPIYSSAFNMLNSVNSSFTGVDRRPKELFTMPAHKRGVFEQEMRVMPRLGLRIM